MINRVLKMFISKASLAPYLVIAAATVTVAQTTTQQTPSNQTSTELNESFEINIPDRRIIEKNFEASTAVELNAPDRNDLRIRVGVALHADSIDVRLRNVTGSVRFHGSLQRILDLLNLRITATPSQ